MTQTGLAAGIMSRTRKACVCLRGNPLYLFRIVTLCTQCCGLFQDRFGETDRNRPKRKRS